MPQLPSGRLIALSPKPLDDLLRQSHRPDNVHKILGILDAPDLYRYVEVQNVVVVSGKGNSGISLDPSSSPLPKGMTFSPAGYCVSDWEVKTSGWSEVDREAFRNWLSGQAAPAVDKWIEAVRREQDRLRGSGDFLTRVLVGWWDAGCHPAQEEGWDASDVGSPEWDDYDMLAAIGQLHALFPSEEQEVEQAEAIARLDSFWGICKRMMPEVGWMVLDVRPVRDCAAEIRSAGLLARLGVEECGWLHDQAVVECLQAWMSFGEKLRTIAPQPYGIFELVVASGEAESQFETRKA